MSGCKRCGSMPGSCFCTEEDFLMLEEEQIKDGIEFNRLKSIVELKSKKEIS